MALRKNDAPAPVPMPSVSSGVGTPAANTAPSTPAPVTAPPALTRDLAAMRARLAGGQNGGVNSPEGAEKITEKLIEPRTQETPDGGAEPIPATSVAGEPSPGTDTTSSALTRGQKAAATRAKNKAASTSAAGDAAVVSTSLAGVQHASAGDPYSDIITLHREAIKVQERIAIALETIARALEDKPEGFSLFERLVIAFENRGRA